jgi:hypothetical protein
VVFLLNRATTKSVTKMTPYQAWSRKRSAIHYFRTFGCIAHIEVTRPGLKKLDDRSMPMVLLGYEPGFAAYRLFHPPMGWVHVSMDVVFDEDAAWEWSSTGTAAEQARKLDSFVVEQAFWPESSTTHTTMTTVTPTAPSPAASPMTTPGASTSALAATPRASLEPVMPPPAMTGVEFVSPPTGATVPSLGEEAPRRYRTIKNLMDTTMMVIEDASGDMCLFTREEPASFNEAETEQGWCNAMDKEMQSIVENGTWELKDLPPGHRAIGLKWVYKLKKDARGAVVKRGEACCKGLCPAPRCGLRGRVRASGTDGLGACRHHARDASRLAGTSHGCEIRISEW